MSLMQAPGTNTMASYACLRVVAAQPEHPVRFPVNRARTKNASTATQIPVTTQNCQSWMGHMTSSPPMQASPGT